MALNPEPIIEIISIEGNIGSGKTTLLTALKTQYKQYPHILFVREPVDEWETIVDSTGVTMLAKFYENPSKYSFAFQMMAYISRMKLMNETIKLAKTFKVPYVYIITERCLYTDNYVFAKMLYEQGDMEDVYYQIYQKWVTGFSDSINATKIVYVNTSAINCHCRVFMRAREGEDIIPLSYLEQCGKYHDSYIYEYSPANGVDILEIDGNLNINNTPDLIHTWCSQVMVFIQTRNSTSTNQCPHI